MSLKLSPVSTDELYITVGMTAESPLNFNISQLPHTLLGATTGAGKSRLLKSIYAIYRKLHTKSVANMLFGQ